MTEPDFLLFPELPDQPRPMAGWKSSSLYDAEIVRRIYARAVRVFPGCLVVNCSLRRGYGLVWVRGKLQSAHRVIYEHHRGPIPAGKVVMHTCDNRRCIELSHLKLGTQAENVADRDRKGRTARGSRQGSAKLTDAKVRAIRQSDEPDSVLAVRFKISPVTVKRIRRGDTWRHIHDGLKKSVPWLFNSGR